MTDGIDTGDHVKHGPTEETWVVARVHGLSLYPCGWPATRAELKDCTLIKKATAAERLKLLRELSQGSSEHASWAANAATQPEDWPALILMARDWFEGNPDAALAELEHRARTSGVKVDGRG
jgi:hypothetical protein